MLVFRRILRAYTKWMISTAKTWFSRRSMCPKKSQLRKSCKIVENMSNESFFGKVTGSHWQFFLKQRVPQIFRLRFLEMLRIIIFLVLIYHTLSLHLIFYKMFSLRALCWLIDLRKRFLPGIFGKAGKNGSRRKSPGP